MSEEGEGCKRRSKAIYLVLNDADFKTLYYEISLIFLELSMIPVFGVSKAVSKTKRFLFFILYSNNDI